MMNTPIRNKTIQGTITTLVAGIAATVAYILRVVARLPWFGGNWGLDDWVMTVAIILVVPLSVCAYILNQIGLGQDMWYVSFDNITEILERPRCNVSQSASPGNTGTASTTENASTSTPTPGHQPQSTSSSI
ncbi:hypothetical protein IG631_12896 [Alternaria alternata]|nr:hypothetical protein IG631_12896 [Alternaria alternata]